MTKCKACGATVLWCVTERGSKMPLAAAPVPAGKFHLQSLPDGTKRALWVNGWDHPEQRFDSHFSSCPKADAFRKKKAKS